MMPFVAEAFEDRFSRTFGSLRGVPDDQRPDDQRPAEAPAAPEQTLLTDSFCSGCGNELYRTSDGWFGHDEDCDRLRMGPDVMPEACSECERPIAMEDGRWSGHKMDCGQWGQAPDHPAFY